MVSVVLTGCSLAAAQNQVAQVLATPALFDACARSSPHVHCRWLFRVAHHESGNDATDESTQVRLPGHARHRREDSPD